MKTKITYLFLILPFLIFAQGPFNFDTSTEGFTCNSSGGALGAHTVTQSVGDLRVDFVTGTGNNPIIKKADAAINADSNINFIEIRLKNLSSISYLRFAPAGTTANYGNVLISTADTQYQTYTIDVTAWTGAAVGIDILCKKNTEASGSGNSYTPVTGEYILIDYIKPLAYLVTPEVNVFNFDSTTEGFSILTRSTAVHETVSSNGTLKVNCNTANANNGKVALSSLLAHVEGTNKYAHIRLKNTSNTLFQLNGKVSGVATAFNPIQTYTTSDMDYKTYDFDLTTWDNGYQFPELNFGVKTTWSATATYAIGVIVISGNTYCKNTSGANSVSPAVPHTDTTNWVIVNASGTIADASPATNGAILGGALDINALTNSVYVDSIVFDNVVPSALSTTDFGNTKNTISLYPNPVQEVLNISSSDSIAKIEVYDIQGRNVASNNNASNVNVVSLGKGVYIIKVVQENGSVITKQFIKE
jgi:hypothetical protein